MSATPVTVPFVELTADAIVVVVARFPNVGLPVQRDEMNARFLPRRRRIIHKGEVATLFCGPEKQPEIYDGPSCEAAPNPSPQTSA